MDVTESFSGRSRKFRNGQKNSGSDEKLFECVTDRWLARKHRSGRFEERMAFGAVMAHKEAMALPGTDDTEQERKMVHSMNPHNCFLEWGFIWNIFCILTFQATVLFTSVSSRPIHCAAFPFGRLSWTVMFWLDTFERLAVGDHPSLDLHVAPSITYFNSCLLLHLHSPARSFSCEAPGIIRLRIKDLRSVLDLVRSVLGLISVGSDREPEVWLASVYR